jgi:hypothetical protein
MTLEDGDSEKATIRCEFEPEQAVDSDMKVLQLRRKEAMFKF